jgi:hypothetical protein
MIDHMIFNFPLWIAHPPTLQTIFFAAMIDNVAKTMGHFSNDATVQ